MRKFAVALMSGEEETILGVFDTREEADFFGTHNRIPHAAGLQYCFAANFSKGMPIGNNIQIYDYYNV